MLLKRLELQGFKSFADKTVLEFHEGTTGVVGPNGSGKSNISDAIRWVIGETSAKSLRGSNMQDVIFTGTAARRGVNYAEVSLVLDNSNHDFNVDYEEVRVTRRLFRSGESIYQINKANCRLKDVHELFMDTGLGRDGYSMIGQGNVAQILSTKAEERRSLFEEAAGVSKYRYKKEEAVRKLQKTDENLVRIGDLTSELESRIAPLEKQSEKARRYLAIYGDMKQLDINLSLAALERNKEERAEAEKLYGDVSAELDEVKSRQSDNERLITSLYEASRAADAEKTAENARFVENEARISKIKNDINIFENNIANNRKNIARLERETEDIKQNCAERAELIERREAEIESADAEVNETVSEMSGARSVSEEYAASISAIDERLAALREDYFNRQKDIASEEERAGGIETLRNSYLERRETVNAEKLSYKEGIDNTRQQIVQTETELAARREKLERLSETADAIAASKAEAERKLKEIDARLNAAKVEYSTKSSKKRMLEGLENDYAGYARSVKAILTARELKELAIYGTISGLTDVDKKYVTAIEAALGGALQNIIVRSEEDAKRAIAYLRRTGGGRATFLPVTSVKGRMLDNAREISRMAGFIGIASELIHYERRYEGIFKSLLGRVVIVDNIDNAIAICRKFGYRFKTVTLEGDVLNAGGSISGGSVNKQSGFISRATEIKSLAAETAAQNREIAGLEAARGELTDDIALADGQLGSFVPLIREYEDEILRLENTLAMLNDSISAGSGKSFDEELKTLEEQLRETADEAARLIAHASSLRTRNAHIESDMAELGERRAELVEKKGEADDRAAELAEKIAELEKSIAVSRGAISSARAEIERAAEDTKNRRTAIEEYSAAAEDAARLIEENKSGLESAKALSEEIRRRLRSIDERKAEIADKTERFQGDSRDILDKIVELERELTRADNRRVKLESERDGTINRLWDDYELGFNDALELRTEVEDPKAAAEELAALKRKLKALGSVNMDSIEEYKSVKERWEFMTAQKADLEKSKDNLTKIIDSMEELMKEHFGDRFNEISVAFGEVFRELFGGGRGRLYLSDPDNLLTSGIEIEVQLPGKGMQNISLYSGGEKSFIAIALLFAILKVKPTPFCILDEIDAALDDVNVSRFATYLKNYIDQTQFIVITHRRGTMEAASVLYGVTMQESGVSKLLSLQIDDVSEDFIE